MPEREWFTPEDREPGVEEYDVSPPDMPPSPAGAGAEDGGEAAASRRFAGSPPDPAQDIDLRTELATGTPEPFLGYDGLNTDEIIAWIYAEDPDRGLLERIMDYEARTRDRSPILDLCESKIQRWNEG